MGQKRLTNVCVVRYKRGGKRFGHVASGALAGAVGAALNARFGWPLELQAPTLRDARQPPGALGVTERRRAPR